MRIGDTLGRGELVGETLKITDGESVIVREHAAEVLEVEAVYGPANGPPPPHFHPSQDERFEVLEGTVSVRMGGAERDFGAGESFEIPRGTVHRMWNPGGDPARVRWQTRPPGRTLEWFRALDRLHAGGKPGPLALAALLIRYREVFRLALLRR